MKTILKVTALTFLLSSFAVADDHGNTRSNATNLGLNSASAGNIERVGDYDYFHILVPYPGTINLSTTGSTDTYGYLYDSYGDVIESDDDGATSMNFGINRALGRGTYYVMVKGFGSHTGRYTLRSSFNRGNPNPTPNDDHGNSTSSATRVGINSTTQGNIDRAGDYDYFRILVPYSGTINLSTMGSTDTYGYLLNSQGTNITSDDDGGSGRNFSIRRSIGRGTYYIKVRHYNSSSRGRYTFRSSFTRGNPSPSPTPGHSRATASDLSLNSTISGSIDTAGVSNYYRIRLNRSGTLRLSTSGSTDTFGILQNSTGGLITVNDDDGSGRNFSISKSLSRGTYYLRLRHYSSSGTGSYRLNSSF